MMNTEPSRGFLEVAGSSTHDLAKQMFRGGKPDQAMLSGFEYRGLNTARWVRAAGADRFVKGFVGDHGYNRRVPKGPLTDAWLPDAGPEPEPFAFFAVGPVDPAAWDNRYLQALLLDYAKYSTRAADPAGRLKDYLVALDDEHTLLLGHAFIALGRARLAATFFVLERLRPIPPGDDVST